MKLTENDYIALIGLAAFVVCLSPFIIAIASSPPEIPGFSPIEKELPNEPLVFDLGINIYGDCGFSPKVQT